MLRAAFGPVSTTSPYLRSRGLHVLYADNHVLAVEKAAGVPVVPDASRDRSLLEQAKAWLKAKCGKPGNVFLGVVHRLDRPASGVVIFARTSKSASRLSESFRARTVNKVYVARSAARVSVAPGHANSTCSGGKAAAAAWAGGAPCKLVQWLRKDRERNRVVVVAEDCAGAKLARTRLRVLSPPAVNRNGDGGGDGGTLLRLEPITGRSHQLRVACASLGLPLLGDCKYGCRQSLGGGRAVALHAAELRVPHPTRRNNILTIRSRALPGWAAGFQHEESNS